MRKLIVHLVSDSSYQAVKYAAKIALSQFSNVKSKEYHWPMIRSEDLLWEALNKIRRKPGVILYTISNPQLRSILKRFALEMKIPCISLIGKIVKEISAFLGTSPEGVLDYSYKFDESYFDTVNAIDYTLRHDDGQLVYELEDADVVLIGPSRTSKTPTSIYLAYNGFKTANIPYVFGSCISDVLEKVLHPIVVGLVINPARLIEIREARMHLLHITEDSNYTDITVVQQECIDVKRLCEKRRWPVIDVSGKSIEEIAALVMKFYYDHKSNTSIK